MAKKILTIDEVKIIKHLCSYYFHEYKEAGEKYPKIQEFLNNMVKIHDKMEEYEGTGLSEEVSTLGEKPVRRQRRVRAESFEEEFDTV